VDINGEIKMYNWDLTNKKNRIYGILYRRLANKSISISSPWPTVTEAHIKNVMYTQLKLNLGDGDCGMV
jgi:hypothetical protein